MVCGLGGCQRPSWGVRSMSATSDGTVVLANVHVGGIQRSTDGGVTWRPTIEVDSDVHEVRAHPSQPRIAIAASAIGLCISRDGGTTGPVNQEGLHATYCFPVAFSGDFVFLHRPNAISQLRARFIDDH